MPFLRYAAHTMHASRLKGVFSTIKRWMPLTLELSMTLASIRMAVLLLSQPRYFDRFPLFYAWLLAHFPNEAWKWGLLAGGAATFKMAGVLCMAWRRSEQALDAAFLLRTIGWSLSVVFWLCFGVSIQIGDAWSLGAICCTTMVMLSLAALVMGPAMPEGPVSDE